MWSPTQLLKSGLLAEQGQPVQGGEELLVRFSYGCQKGKNISAVVYLANNRA